MKNAILHHRSTLNSPRAHWIIWPLILILCLIGRTGFAKEPVFKYHLSNIGDQGSVLLSIDNATTSYKQFSFGPKRGAHFERDLSPFEGARFLIQCHKRGDLQSHPELSLFLGSSQEWIPPFVVRSSDPKNVIWIEAERKYRQTLEPLFISAIHGLHGKAPISINASAFPTHLSALTRTSLIMTSLSTFSSLSDERRQVLKTIVAAGATLVIGTGEMGGDDKVLNGFSPVALGDVNSNSGALLANMMRVPSYRTIYMKRGVYPLVMADEAPILVESRLGMGRVRVLAVKMNALTPGPISAAALTLDERPHQQLYQWLDMSMPPLTAPPRLLTNHFWILLLLIPLLFWAARGRPLVILSVSLLWTLVAFVRTPLYDETYISRAHMLYLPLDEGALVFGQVDVNSFRKGARSVQAHPMSFGLISTETEGACLIHEEKGEDQPVESWWVFDSEVGERQRFKYISYVNRTPRDTPHVAAQMIPQWPKGPWSGVRLEPLSPILFDLPLRSDLDHIKAWRLPSTPPMIEPQPLILTDTGPE